MGPQPAWSVSTLALAPARAVAEAVDALVSLSLRREWEEQDLDGEDTDIDSEDLVGFANGFVNFIINDADGEVLQV